MSGEANLDTDQEAKHVSAKLAELKGQAQEALDSHNAEQEEPKEAPPPNQETEESSVNNITFQEMSGPQQVAAFNAMASRAGRKGIEVSPVKRFKNHKIGVERLIKLETKLASAGSPSPAKVGKTKSAKSAKSASKAAKKAAAPAKPKFGHDRTIVSVVSENPRFKGTKAFKLFEEMSAWVKKHKGKPVSQLIEETNYRRQDFDWDVKRKSIEVKKI